jgi:hypothetical protein
MRKRNLGAMLIEVIGKGKKHRHTLHSKELLEELSPITGNIVPKPTCFHPLLRSRKISHCPILI